MRILQYLLGVVFFCAVFLICKWMAERGNDRNTLLVRNPRFSACLCNFVHYSGRICQIVAVVWAFIDAVSVMLLTAGWITDLFVSLQATE